MQTLTVNTLREHPQRLFNFQQIANSQSGVLHPQDLQFSFPTTCRNSKEKRNEETQQLNRIAQGPMYELFSLLLLLMMTMNTFHSLSLQLSKIAPLLSLPGGGQDCLQLTAIPQEKPYSS
jgi:hypothetical protein